jgi:hypothetical protein
MNTPASQDFAAEYAKSVQQERTARQALQSYAPGAPERAEAWARWMDAIAQTNKVWRQLSASRATQPWARPAAGQPSRHAGR